MHEGCGICVRLREAIVPFAALSGLPVDVDELGAFAGLTAGEAEAHVGRDASGLVVAAYGFEGHRIMDCQERAFTEARDWRQGLRAWVARLIAELAERPIVPQFMAVVVHHGGRA